MVHCPIQTDFYGDSQARSHVAVLSRHRKTWLARLLNQLFEQMDSPLRVEDFWLGAAYRNQNLSVNLYLAANERAFSFDLWQDGISLGGHWLPEPEQVAQILHAFFILRKSPLDLEVDFAWFHLTSKAKLALQSPQAYTEAQWKNLEDWLREDETMSQLLPVLQAAHAHPRLGVLYPFTSLFSLQFSSCTGFPFDCPCPGIWGPRNAASGDYSIMPWGDDQVAEETMTIEAAITFIASKLPPDCGPARGGTVVD